MGFIESHLVIRARLPHTAGEEENQPPSPFRRGPFLPLKCVNLKRASPRWRDGRVAEGARLESVFRGNSNVGSNPTLSARIIAFSTAYSLFIRYNDSMFHGPPQRLHDFVIRCKGCGEHIAAPVETMPSGWIINTCPLCGERRKYLPAEIFRGRLSFDFEQWLRKAGRTKNSAVPPGLRKIL